MGELLGSGSTGEVFLAELTKPWLGLEVGTPVAIKRLLSSLWGDKAEERLLLAEGELGLRVQSPGLVRVLATGYRASEGAPEIIMEWIPGETLEAVLLNGAYPEPLLRTLAQMVGRGLSSLHKAGYAHADVKPENIKLDGEGSARLIDLGYATRFDPSAKDPAELEHEPGSLKWMSPERLIGGPPSFAADVYALGLVLYAAATECHPSQRDGNLPEPSTIQPSLTPLFDDLVGEMLNPNPVERPSAEEVTQRFGAGESSPWWQAQIVALGEVEASSPRARGPLSEIVAIGRKAELAKLSALRKREVRGSNSPLLLTGEEGSGKWELVHEFAARARRSNSPPLFLSGRATEMSEVRPYGTLLEILRIWLGTTQSKALSSTHRARLAHLLTPRSANTLAGILDPMPSGPIEGSVQAALTEWVLALAEQSPTILFVDELQDAGEETLRTLLKLSSSARSSSQLFLIFGERDDLVTRPEQRLEEIAAQRIQLGPLSRESMAAIVSKYFDKAAPQFRLVKVLMDRSRGNPALLHEVLLALESAGATRSKNGKLHLEIKPESLPFPASLRASITARFKRLDRAHRSVLARMAILAGHLSPTLLRRAFDQEREEDLAAITSSLARQRWLVPDGDHFRFARPALREAVLSALSPASRKHLHGIAAAGLAPRPGEKASVGMGTRRAWHLREAGDFHALLSSVRSLIRALNERGQPQRTASLADWGLEALSAIESETPQRFTLEYRNMRLGLLEQAVDCANRLGAREKERRLLDSLAELGIDTDSDPFRTARIYLLFGRHAGDTGAYGIARGLLRNAHEFAVAAGRPLFASRALARLAEVLAESGDLKAAREHATKAWEIAKDSEPTRDQPAVLAGAELTLAHVSVLQGKPDKALLHVDSALAILRHEQSYLEPSLRARAHLLRARIWRDLGRPERARGSAHKARELSRLAHERALESEAAARMGGLLVDAGKMEDAEAHLRDALLISGEIEDKRGMCLAQVWLGTLLAEANDPEAASALAKSAKLASAIGLRRCEAMAYALGARVELCKGNFEGAHVLGQRAMSMLESQGAELRDRIVITGTWALLLFYSGERAEASKLSKELRRVLRKASAHIEDSTLRKLHRTETMRLLSSVLSAEGPIYPRAVST